MLKAVVLRMTFEEPVDPSPEFEEMVLRQMIPFHGQFASGVASVVEIEWEDEFHTIVLHYDMKDVATVMDGGV